MTMPIIPIPNDSDGNSRSPWYIKYKLLIAIVAPVFVAVIVVVSIVSSVFSLNNEGERRQEQVEAMYDQSRTSLSSCIDRGAVAAQVTEREFETLRELLTDVAAARYTDNGQPTDASAVIGGGQMFSMVQEAYPQIDQRSWQNLQTVVVGCRSEFKSSQDRLIYEATEFETWIQTDTPFNAWIKNNYPTDTLDVVTSDGVLTGENALAYMTRVIEVEEAQTAFETGTLDEQDLFGDN